MIPFPWHFLVPSVAVAGHWYWAMGPQKPFSDVVEFVRNVTGITSQLVDEGVSQCSSQGLPACRQSHYDELMTEFMDRFQSKRTIYDRWGTFVICGSFCAIPFIVILSLCLPRLMSSNLLLRTLTRHSRALEVIGYASSLLCGVIARNLDDMPSAAQNWGRGAAFLFVVSHIVFGTLRQRDEGSKRFLLEWLRACNAALSPVFLSAHLHALVWAAAAKVHQDSLCGLLAMAASSSSLLAHWSELQPCFAEGTELAPEGLMWTVAWRLATVSAFMMLVSQAALRECKYLTLGAMCFGHIAALAAMLVLSLGQNKIGSSFGRQGAALGAFSCSILLGLILDAPSLASGGASGLLMWFWVKCLEAPWANPLFKAFITVGLVQLIRQHPEIIQDRGKPWGFNPVGGWFYSVSCVWFRKNVPNLVMAN